MSYQVLNPDASDSYTELLQLVDNHLTIKGTSANPNADVDSAVAGIFYFNTDTEALWVCTTAGTAGVDVVWKRLYFSIDLATTDEAGIIQLATADEVSAGLATDRAVTPASLGATFESVSSHDADIATVTSSISALSSTVSGHTSTLNAATSEASATTLAKRDGNGNLKVATPTDPAHAATMDYVDTADSDLQSQITDNTNDLSSATSAATANKIARRDGNANISVGNATSAAHAVRKDTVDALNSTVSSLSSTVSTNGTNISTLQGQMSTVQSDILANAGDIATNAGDISDLQTDLTKVLGGAAGQGITLDSSGNGTPTSGIIALTPETGTTDTCNHLLTTNGIKLIGVYNAVPGTNSITLAHGSSGDGYLSNQDSGNITLSSAGQMVFYVLVTGGTNYYKEVGRVGFASGGSVSMLKAENITSSLEALPTSGNWDKPVYIHYGDWTSSGAITITVPIVRIYIKGNFTLNHTITQSSTAVGNGGNIVPNSYTYAGNGGGYMGSGGPGGVSYLLGGYAFGGSGGANGGAGGDAGGISDDYDGPPASLPIPFLHLVPGGGGGAGIGYGAGYDGGAGGQGGAALYLEAYGNIAFNESVTLSGANGSITEADNYNGGGGAGAGGTIITLCTGTWSLASGKSLTTAGGNGGSGRTSGARGGGGGGGRQYHRSVGTLTNSGSLVVSGGTKGSAGVYTNASNGSSGVSSATGSVSAVYSLF